MTARSRAYVFLFSILTLTGGVRPAWAQEQTSTAAGFGGDYSSLRPPQKRLVDDWFNRFSATVKKKVDPAIGYNSLPLSTKTTFNAVTHALLTTKLTDNSGKSVGESSIDLVDKLDGVAGQVVGARGDQQFRIYVQLKAGVLDLLNRSKEFERGPDNTVYHKGYPTSFRTSGTPSIQISLTRDAARADIDVDYRSSRFPKALVNGHLTASNSDVRSGDNDVRHNTQWSGLQNWWRSLLGLPLAEQGPVSIGGRVLASEPKVKGKPEEAIFEFLNAWLVGQAPNESIAYFSDESLACMEVEKGTKLDRGMSRVTLLQAMIALNQRLGKISSLSGASIAVPIESERLKIIEQPHSSQFALYNVREDLAEEFKCENRLDASLISSKALKSTDFGKYVGASFRIKENQNASHVLVTLWQKEHDYWRLISYDVDPEIDRSRTPNLSAQPTAPSVQYVGGDKAMTKSASDFFRQWFVKKDIDKALEYVASECLPCIKVYLDEGAKPPSTSQEEREVLKQAMARTVSTVGTVKNLEDAIVAAEPHHEDIKLVKHADAKAFAIASVPESMGTAADCQRRKPNGDPDYKKAAAEGYGKYYATGFSVGSAKASPAILWIFWASRDGAWKAVSFVLVEP